MSRKALSQLAREAYELWDAVLYGVGSLYYKIRRR